MCLNLSSLSDLDYTLGCSLFCCLSRSTTGTGCQTLVEEFHSLISYFLYIENDNSQRIWISKFTSGMISISKSFCVAGKFSPLRLQCCFLEIYSGFFSLCSSTSKGIFFSVQLNLYDPY